MRRSMQWAVGLAAGLWLAAMPATAEWTLTEDERPVAEGATVSETVWQTARAPGGAFDRIGLHRYRAPGETVATMLYLPGTNMNGAAALTDERHNLWIYLAARGIEVYAIDYRTHAVPDDATPEALSVMKGWDTALFVEDIADAATFARAQSGRDGLFVAGFSRGAFLAYAYAASGAKGIKGLVILDGPFKSAIPKADFDAAAALAKLTESGAWASDIGGSLGYAARQALMAAVAANPDAPATESEFKTIGQQLAHVLQTAWGPGALANPEGGVSTPQVLARLLIDYDRWYPAIQDISGGSISNQADDPATPLDDLWGEMDTPILVFAGTGMGGQWLVNALHAAAASGSKDVTYNVLEGYGHLDVLVGEQAAETVFEPVVVWIKARAGN